MSPRGILVAEFMDEAGRARLAAGDRPVTYSPELAGDPRALCAAVAGASALVVRNRARVDAAVLAAAGPALRVVGRLGAGTDNIDLGACRTAGVRVVSARGANADAVCEYVFAALLHLARNLPAADAAVRAGTWPREIYQGRELAGRTLGVVGLGEVGRRLCRRGAAFGMRPVGCDALLGADAPVLADVPVRWVPFEEVLACADVLSLHVPLTRATQGLIGARALARMRPGATLVNTARGGIVDEAALAKDLRAGHLAGAVLDVREVEPPPRPDPLQAFPGVLLTPHVAGLTAQAQARVGQMVADDVLAVLAGREPVAAAV